MSMETLTPTANTAWRVDVNTSTTEVPEWVQVRAANGVSPTVNDTVQDATDYDSEGWGSDAITLRKWQLVLALLRKLNAAKEHDPGQEAIRAAADSGELLHVRWYDRSTPTGEAYEGHALAQWNPAGGDATGLQLVNSTLLGQGPRNAIAHPGAPVGP